MRQRSIFCQNLFFWRSKYFIKACGWQIFCSFRYSSN